MSERVKRACNEVEGQSVRAGSTLPSFSRSSPGVAKILMMTRQSESCFAAACSCFRDNSESRHTDYKIVCYL
jgi:hypothetical protein